VFMNPHVLRLLYTCCTMDGILNQRSPEIPTQRAAAKSPPTTFPQRTKDWSPEYHPHTMVFNAHVTSCMHLFHSLWSPLSPPPPCQRYVNHTINGSPNDTGCPRRICRTERKAPLAVSTALSQYTRQALNDARRSEPSRPVIDALKSFLPAAMNY